LIPVRLCLEDFLSYRGPQELDFTSFEVACLTGSNGQGKSSLLDAMTWAMFGAARGCEGGQNQERVIRDGADRTTVAFEFDLGGARYRIVRKRARTGRSDLTFDVMSEGAWTTLAGDTATETQTRICDVLRLDHRTFTASAFFLQGRADDFLTRMKPEDRKDVFSRLLDLGVYDRLAEEARTRSRDAERERKQHAERIEELRDADTLLEACRVELAGAQERALAAAEAATVVESELEAKRTELTRIEKTEAAASALRQAVTESEARIAADRQALAEREREATELDRLLARAPEVDRALAEESQLRERDTAMREASERRSELELRRTELEGRIAAEENAIGARATQLREQADRAAAEAGQLARAAEQLEEVDARLATLDGLRAEMLEVRQQRSELREEFGRLGAELSVIEATRTALSERLDILHRGGGECPVCAGPLDEPHRTELISTLKEEDAAAAARHEAVAGRREVVRKEGLRLKEEEERLTAAEEELQGLARTAAGLRERLGRLPGLRETEETARTEAALLLGQVQDGTATAALRAELAAVNAGLADVAYDRRAHDTVRARLEELSRYATLRGQIEGAVARRQAVSEELEVLTARLTQQEEALAERRGALRELVDTLADADRVRADVGRAREAAAAAQRAAAEAGASAARLSERLDSLRQRSAELAAARTAELEAATTGRRYSRLATSFGRGGIPDLIIENALPELTQDANEILGRLSDYEMSVQFVMDKLTKGGKVKETFDVLVGHDGGLRDFQMFSGGEAFRIAFSIRLALSKLLLRRAGARMETLVIDEGFGSQDPEGRERLVEAINLARAEFRKVIVITHLDELKEAFGTQIRVWKHPRDGSRAEIAGV